MIEKTKSERGYAGTGRLIHRILHTLSGVYPINSRFVNSDEWDSPGLSLYVLCVCIPNVSLQSSTRIIMCTGVVFVRLRMLLSSGTVSRCHFALSLFVHSCSAAPSTEEIDFVLLILDKIASPSLDTIEHLLDSAGHWDNVASNDFCR